MSWLRGFLMVLMLGSVISIAGQPSSQDKAGFQDRELTLQNKVYRYKVFVPSGWKSGKKWPIILFLHGAGERGDDNTAQARVGIGPALEHQEANFRAVVVLPQCPRNRWWSESEMQAIAMKALEESTSEFHGDPSRLYLTGLSMGGYGAWTMARHNPGMFAAIGVICGGVRRPPNVPVPPSLPPEDPGVDPYKAVAEKVGKTPVWVFHGGADPIVPVTESRKMVEALKTAGGDVRYTEYDGVGHNSWDKAYAEPDFFKWLLEKKNKRRSK